MAITYNVVVLSLMVVLLSSISFGSAKVYTVGDSTGWALGVDYTTWASGKSFKVGDSLVFNYDTSHTVDLVTSSDYKTCTTGNSIASYNSGTTTISLNTTGSQYFICGIIGHCTGGMKLSIDVSNDGSPSAAPSSPTADSPTTPLGTTTLPPPTVAGTSNVPVDSSTPVTSAPLVATGLCLFVYMYEWILA